MIFAILIVVPQPAHVEQVDQTSRFTALVREVRFNFSHAERRGNPEVGFVSQLLSLPRVAFSNFVKDVMEMRVFELPAADQSTHLKSHLPRILSLVFE